MQKHKRHKFESCVRKIPWGRAWQPTPVFFPGESQGQRSLAGAWARRESQTTEGTSPAGRADSLHCSGELTSRCKVAMLQVRGREEFENRIIVKVARRLQDPSP